MSNVPYMCFFGKQSTRAPDALPARLGRAAGPGLARPRSAAAVGTLSNTTTFFSNRSMSAKISENEGRSPGSCDGPARRRGARAVDPAREGGGAF